MIVVILDSPRYESVARQLSLPEDVLQLTAPVENIGASERVIYIASLDSGGSKAQKDILRNNPQVEEWFVLSIGAEEDSWKSFRENMSSVKAPVYTFSSIEDLVRAMERPVIRRNSCLVLSKKETPDADELIKLLGTWLPDWSFEKATFETNPEICFNTTCSRILILGRKPYDFQGVSFPETHTPLLVVTHMEDNVLQSLRPRTLVNNIFKNVIDFRWSEEVLTKNLFLVSTAYETFRVSVKNDSDLLNSLAADSRFDMWDCYGLPENRNSYTKERMTEFLNQFNGCERIADILLKKTD